jgi:hypothetical protein
LLPLAWSGGSHSVYACYKFSVRSFGSIQGFKGDDFSSRLLVLRGTCTLPDCHQQRQDDYGKGAAIAARRRLALAVVVVVRWSKDLNVLFIMFGLPFTSCEFME